MEMEVRSNLAGLTAEELHRLVSKLGEPGYRARQIFAAVHARRVRSFEEMTDLPKELRATLNEQVVVATLKLESRYVSIDGTRRYLFKTHDNRPVETVFIPEERRDTICFSSQSGCPLQCTFCLTAQLGLLRNLNAGEIVEQIIFALNDAYGIGMKPPRGTNLVGMGAGEPFLAFDSLMKALRIIADPKGLHIVPNRFEQSLRRGERLTFEYVMLDGINDSDEQARQLANLLNRHELRLKVNLIPHNPAEPLPYQSSPMERLELFREVLESKGVHAYVRKPRGRDILAACGQLAARGTVSEARPLGTAG